MKSLPAVRLPSSLKGKITRLEKLRTGFSSSDLKQKLALVEVLAKTEILDPQLLLRYHEVLLFMRAYPETPGLLRRVRAQTDSFGNRIELLRSVDPDGAEELDDSGIASTTTLYWYDLATLESLVRWHGDALEVDWEVYETNERVDALLPMLVEWVENDGLDLADMTTGEWIAAARGSGSGGTDLRWLLKGLGRLSNNHRLKRVLFDSLELPIRWNLAECASSRTHACTKFPEPTFHSDGLQRQVDDFRGAIRRKRAMLEPLDPKRGREMVRTVRCALAVRHRALYPIEYASAEDVLVADCPRGYQFVLFGMLPEFRLPLESDYGVMILKNGQIIGYGVGAMLFEQVEIAVNIFDTWRGGESALIFSEFMRVFHQQFLSTRFKIERYQVGFENDEGLKSGSFWFYHKLGFVPEDSDTRALAAQELAKRRSQPGYRTPISILEKLALSDMFFSLRGDPTRVPAAFPLDDLSMASTRLIADQFGGDRRRARRECAATASRLLRCRTWTRWPRWEKEWFERFSLIVAQIPDLPTWPTDQRRDLLSLIRAKGQQDETDFVKRLARHRRFRKALGVIAHTGES